MTIQVASGTPTAGQLRVSRRPGAAWPLLCLLPGLWALLARPPLPLDELRYLSVGWEMWQRSDFLVPHLNGVPYSHKPPLLFWLMHAGWAVFGVNEWWPRMIGPLCSLLAVALAVRLARELWPGDRRTAELVPWVLAGSVGWIVLGQMLMFDMLLAVFVLVGLIGLWRAAQEGRAQGFALFAAGMGGGLLTKGPVTLIHVLVPALLAPWWAPGLRARPLRWYGLLLGCTLGSLVLAGLWALPAAAAGGPGYAQAILWGQTAGRVDDSFAHARPWFSYLLFIPAMLLPWGAAPALWRRRAAMPASEPGTRFLVATAGSAGLALSVLSAKQPHYALPLLAVLGLLIAHRLGGRVAPAVALRLAMGTAAVLLVAASAILAIRGEGLDLRPPALAIARLQQAGAEVAIADSYKGQFGFLGRLGRPLPVVPRGQTREWAAFHPGAYLVTTNNAAAAGLALEHHAGFAYRGGHMDIWRVPAAAPTGAAP